VAYTTTAVVSSFVHAWTSMRGPETSRPPLHTIRAATAAVYAAVGPWTLPIIALAHLPYLEARVRDRCDIYTLDFDMPRAFMPVADVIVKACGKQLVQREGSRHG
jgi:hypothetical protein